jgi:uncharacterized protein
VPLLMLGGAFLCFEGVEKLRTSGCTAPAEDRGDHAALVEAAVADPEVDLVAFERDKIKGAIRTDFILSAEIIVIALGTVAAASFSRSSGAGRHRALMTVGVYGLVAGIVKLDDLGLYLTQRAGGGASRRSAAASSRRALADEVPVGGRHRRDVPGRRRHPGARHPPLHHLLEGATAAVVAGGAAAQLMVGMLVEGLVGLLAGVLVVGVIAGGKRMFGRGGG